jgi:DNA-binding beta-propeller fold protein YncE
VINTLNDSVLATIPMGGEVGNTHYDPVSKLIYSAEQTTNELVEIDPVLMKIRARYKLLGCKGAHGFLIEPGSRYAFVTGEDNASYVVFDLSARKIIDHGTVGGEPDVLAFDEGYHRLYVSSESGVVSVFKVTKEGVKKLCQGVLAPHAHTVFVDQLTHKVYFPLQEINGKPVLRVMKPVISGLSKD